MILKTQHANASIIDRDNILKKIDEVRKTVRGSLPNIYVIHGEMDDSEVNELYNHPKVKAMINFTKGEGFGRPLLEFSAVGKPIIASGWSGHLDFLNKEFVTLVGGTLHEVDNSAVQKGIIIKEAKWIQPNDGEVANAMKDVFGKYKKYVELARRQRHYVKTNFSLDKMAEQLNAILSQRLPEFPKQVKLELPKLQLPKLQKI